MKYGIENNNNSRTFSLVGRVVADLSEIFDTTKLLIAHHAGAIAQAKQMDKGDLDIDVPQTF